MERIAIVTGGASGLGRFITQRLSAEGAHVLLADIDSAAGGAAPGGGAVVNIASSGALEPLGYGSPEYAAAKAGLIRFTTAVRDTALRSGVRVSCVVPHWIGLDRAVAEFEGLSPLQRTASGGLVDPERVTDVVLQLSRDSDAAGRVTVLRAGREPYDINPAAADPLWRELSR